MKLHSKAVSSETTKSHPAYYDLVLEACLFCHTLSGVHKDLPVIKGRKGGWSCGSTSGALALQM